MTETDAPEPPRLLPPQLRRAWGMPQRPGKRGRRPSLELDTIIAQAAGLADAGGIASVSLVRLADALNVTTNALYRYVDSREELDVLLREYALADPPVTAPNDDWRTATRDWAALLRERYLRHPWLADLTLTVPITPNALGWLEALLAALESSPLPAADVLRAATLLDGYVRVQFISQRDLGAWTEHPLSDRDVVEQVAPLIDERGYRRVAALFGTGQYQEPTIATHDADFEYGLERILRGIAG
ncbi:MAG TPA: TetR/AcrR family transcriptional regulator C-terminal domain-containing protein [Microbacterium sp.]|nr:TetR/AcrR family transcriptional regulator C-terminal domain-containing protein [Microbacterium sp.]